MCVCVCMCVCVGGGGGACMCVPSRSMMSGELMLNLPIFKEGELPARCVPVLWTGSMSAWLNLHPAWQ